MKKFSAIMTITVSYFFVLLFIYASISKVLDFENFQSQIALSPLLSSFAASISYGVIISEMIIVVLLIFPKSRIYGLYASLGLMSAFTIYIYLILNYSDFIPCSCGGILEKMTWDQHIIFNIISTLILILTVYFSQAKDYKILKTTGLILLTILLGCSTVILLFVRSEHMMKKENNFTRRFHHHLITEDIRVDLAYNSYYFAGYDNQNIYLGNSTTPLIITKLDYDLKNRETQKIKINPSKYQFRNLQLNVVPPHFYLSDGSVPVIYKGNLNHQQSSKIFETKAYFNQSVIIDSTQIAFRAKNTISDIHILGKEDLNMTPNLKLNNDILAKRSDGVFASDGQLIYNSWLKKIIYLHYYRNQILLINNNLVLDSEMKTIDTISDAAVNTKVLSDGTKKFSKPPFQVNLYASTHKNILFVNSNLRGRHENVDQWKNSSVVDYYNIKDHSYLGSFYIPKDGQQNIKQFIATDKYLYVLKGKEIFRYRFARPITDLFLKGDAENP